MKNSEYKSYITELIENIFQEEKWYDNLLNTESVKVKSSFIIDDEGNFELSF